MIKELFIDVETTGTLYWKHAIHQISGIVVIDGIEKERFDFKVRPHENAKIELEALNIAGITQEKVMSYPTRKDGFTRLLLILDKYVDRYDVRDKFFFVAYNSHFDNAFLRAFFKQCEHQYFGSYFWSGSIDVMVLALEKLREKRAAMENFKLMSVARELGIEVQEEKAHDAIYDVEITKRIYESLQR